MAPLHAQEKEQFKKLFQQERVENFDDRFKVLEAFFSTEKHVTADELAGRLNAKGAGLSTDFVRDTLKMLSRLGFARQSRFDNGVVRYEHHHLGDHHDHMICTKCGKIIEFKVDRLEAYQIKIAANHGFHMLRHKMEIYGICADCGGGAAPRAARAARRRRDRPEPVGGQGRGARRRARLGALRLRRRAGDRELRGRARRAEIAPEEFHAIALEALAAGKAGRAPAPRLLYTEAELREVRKLQAIALAEPRQEGATP